MNAACISDARRFARLLVSEIKLYNEKKVVQGRRLGTCTNGFVRPSTVHARCTISAFSRRSLAKFDYFHYELR